MFQFARTYLLKPISIALAIYMINLSVDVADQPDQFDPNVNEIESIVELVFEVMLDQGNVIMEEDEPDPETSTCFVGLYHIIPTPTLEIKLYHSFSSKNPTGYLPVPYTDPSLSINPDPPQG